MAFEYYDILGVSKGASQDEIKRAYKKLAFEHHPDKGGDEKKFQDLSNAYNVLSDPQKRSDYDRTGTENPGRRNGGFQQQNAHDIFKHFFNQHQQQFRQQGQQPKRCNDATHNLSISLEDAARGMNKQFKIKLKVFNKSCFKSCTRCDGTGQLQNVQNMGLFTQVFSVPCKECGACGFSKRPDCKEEVSSERECAVNLEIPPGVLDNHKIVVEGKGEQPKVDGMLPGNLIFNVSIKPHKTFVRDGNNLHSNIKISFVSSIVGDVIPMNILDIETFDLDLKRFGIIQPNKQYVFDNKGMPLLNNKNKRGNLILTFDIEYPILTDNQRENIRNAMRNILNY